MNVIREYAKSREIEIVADYSDEGKSGLAMTRAVR